MLFYRGRRNLKDNPFPRGRARPISAWGQIHTLPPGMLGHTMGSAGCNLPRPTARSSPVPAPPAHGLREPHALGWEPPGGWGHPQKRQQPRWHSHCLASREAGAVPREPRFAARPAWSPRPLFPSVLLQLAGCPCSDQGALAALRTAANEAS